ncbi:site-2 protease family protein [Candidatus Micrarchaeota archaeon CG10_big_fil_rev_8_21_14_0_10_59_7]|nr:MAG: site-2 protease family protein [Candidatus Micrarchaeota archaeon CG10_big_fil_rev_8_21_14_0_10_59_7]
MNSEEILHIAISVVGISLAFSLFRFETFNPSYFLIILVTVGLGFVLHELAHKYVAIHYGAHAQYRMWTTGLFLAIAMAFVTRGGFVFAAPGAVYIFGHVGRDKTGKIALAGPLMNLLLALVFLAAAFVFPGAQELCFTGAFVNIFLGGFNMIPFAPMDGQKVATWDQRVWGGVFALFIVAFLGFSLI